MTIGTHAFYLAVAGGRKRVSGYQRAGHWRGQHRAHGARVLPRFHPAHGAKLRSSPTLGRATLQAATDLYGGGSNERAQVELAWNAVGVN
jgi:hypothetical protein